MSDQKNADVVRQAYNNFKTGNIQALLNSLSIDVDWRLPEIKGVPHSGAHRGRDQVGKFFAAVAEHQEALEFEPREFVSEGDKVVSIGHYQWRIRPTGKKFASDFVHIFTVRGGQIVGFLEFLDTAAETEAWAK